MEMTEKELRELDAWIAVNVFPYSRLNYKGGEWPKYTTDPAPAMEVLKKCADKRTVAVNCDKDGTWCMAFIKPAVLGACCVDEAIEAATTLELAICLFAKQVFSNQPTKSLTVALTELPVE